MRRTKRLGALLIALVMLFAMLPITTASAASLSGNIVLVMNSDEFTVNGTKTKIDAEGSKPVQENGYTMLPLRAILEATGGTLSYDAATQKITIVRGGDTVVLTLNSKVAVVNGVNRSLGAEPYAKNNRTLVHIRTLELFGMKVDWDSATNNVTVNYVEPTKIFNLTLQNGMGKNYTSVQIAPMTTGTPDWSGNLLGADVLNINQNLIVQAPITGTGFYQLRCGYKSSNTVTLYDTISNIDLTGMTDKATILMNSTTTPGVGLDGSSSTTRNLQLYIINNTGRVMTALYARKTGDTYYDQTNLLGMQVLSNGGTATATFKYDSANPYHDFYAVFQNGTQEAYNKVQLSVSTSLQNFSTITLGSNGVANSGSGSNSTSTGSTQITFRNNSGSRVYELRASTSSGTSSIKNGTTVWSDSSGVKDGSTVTFTMDLKDTYRWHFGAYTSTRTSGNPAYTGSVNFKTSGVTSARLTLSRETDGYVLMDYDVCDYCVDYENSSDAKTIHSNLKADYGSEISESKWDSLTKSERNHYEEASSDASFSISQIKTDGSSSSSNNNTYGDVDLNLAACSTSIKEFYVISQSDYKDSSMKDPDDFDGEYENLLDGTLSIGEHQLIKDALETGSTNYVAWVSGSKLYKTSFSVDKDADWVSATNTSTSSLSTNDSEDEKVLAIIENEGISGSVKVTMSNDDGSESVSLSNGDVGYKWLNTRYDSEWKFSSSDVSRSDTIDLDDYDGFVYVTFTSSRFTFSEIDD